MYIYDFGVSQTSPVATLDCNDSSAKTPVYAMAFNPKQRDFVATGNGAGYVQVWKLSWKLSNNTAGEQGELDKMAEAIEEEA
jgi:hypothetical protein